MRNSSDRVRSGPARGTGPLPTAWGYDPRGRDRALGLTAPVLGGLLVVAFLIGFAVGWRFL